MGMLRNKLNRITERDLVNGKVKSIVNKLKTLGLTIMVVVSNNTVEVFANPNGDLAKVGEDIREIFNPITDLLASLGYPTAYVMLIVGGLMIITGRKARGIEVIKWASVGYISLQLVPFILNVLEMVGMALRGSMR